MDAIKDKLLSPQMSFEFDYLISIFFMLLNEGDKRLQNDYLIRSIPKEAIQDMMLYGIIARQVPNTEHNTLITLMY